MFFFIVRKGGINMGNETYYRLKTSVDSDSIQLEEVSEMESPEVEKVKMSVSNKALIVSIVAVVLYTVLAFVLQFCTSVEVSPTLTECWYRFFTVEIFALMTIKVTKVFKDYDKSEPVNKDEGVSE